MRRIAICVVALCLASAVAWADPTDDFVKAQLQEFGLPGLSLAVIRDGSILKSDGYGMADRDRKVPATRDTVYKIGSVSKQFIATGIMLLVQDKLLRSRRSDRQVPRADAVFVEADYCPPSAHTHVGSHTRVAGVHVLEECERCRAAQGRTQGPSAFRAGREVGVFQHGLRGARRDHSHRGAPAMDGLSASETLRARRR